MGVQRPDALSEVFHFVRKRVLFIGLNLVGGRVHNRGVWRDKQTAQVALVQDLMENTPDIYAVVLMAHAAPSSHHNDFFVPLKAFLQSFTDYPVLYLNGDAHSWKHVDGGYFGVNHFSQIQLTGGTSEPPLKISIHPKRSRPFLYDRRL